MNVEVLRQRVRAGFVAREKLKESLYAAAVRETMHLVDGGVLRVAQEGTHGWEVNAWIQEAILLFFALSEMKTMEVPPFEFHDKIPLKRGLAAAGVRVVPPGVVRYGAFCEKGVVIMPGYVNIGAWVGANTMIDSWATVGSCAQVGRNVHISGGVGLGGVLEPPSAQPVIVEDGAFIGSRSVIVEGVRVEKEAVIGANTVLTASTPIIDVTGPQPITHKAHVPARSVVIPGVRTRDFPAGAFQVPCALIIGQRSAATDKKTSLNQVLRDLAVPV